MKHIYIVDGWNEYESSYSIKAFEFKKDAVAFMDEISAHISDDENHFDYYEVIEMELN